jgi:hypothetical protein
MDYLGLTSRSIQTLEYFQCDKPNANMDLDFEDKESEEKIILGEFMF